MKIDLSFRIRGSHIPVDHGYALFSALSSFVPAVHGSPPQSPAVLRISGRLIGNRRLAITDLSRLTFRCPTDDIGRYLPITGQTLRIGDSNLVVGTPEVRMLKPASVLWSWLVAVKVHGKKPVSADYPEAFLAACRRQLDRLGIKGTASMPARRAGFPTQHGHGAAGGIGTPTRRTIRIAGVEVVGFALVVEDLQPEGSILLQEEGIGGRHHFGCGIFVPATQRIGGAAQR
ncbi:MAG TPA: type I-MYXAN CRISPR-associated protein Cas6/Cmx6 [Verrucomicrobiae bacterium]|nr:type I-MYXAN CRISPR-associated protein Cas6/Cmx6 [Verrucomicrobiae bacterium]